MGKHRQLILLVAACILALAPAPSAQIPQPLLPEKLGSAQRADWKTVEPAALESVTPATAPLLREYGARHSEYAEFRAGGQSLRVLVHEMPDRSAAYGAFTLLRGHNEAATFGEQSARLSNGVVFYQANYLVTAEGSPGVEVLRLLARSLAERSPDQASLPNLPLYLPSEGLIRGSDAYILGPLALERVAPLAQGDWVGFAYGAEVEAARYRVGGREATLLLISYPTPQMARQRLADLGRLFNLNQSGSSGGPVAFARRKSSLLVFATGLETAQEFDAMAAGVAYQPELSWSEPEPIDDKEIISGLLGIFLGTGLIVVLTVALGLAFGAARLLLLTALPGRVFDKPVENDGAFLNLQNPK